MIEEIAHAHKESLEVAPRGPHPFELALSWRQEIENDPRLNQAKIAAREGISPARVTQIMALLQLPAEIQNDLLCPPAPLNIHSFPERRLRFIVLAGDEAAQMSLWRKLLQKLECSVRK
jgi:hypothetical protein